VPIVQPLKAGWTSHRSSISYIFANEPRCDSQLRRARNPAPEKASLAFLLVAALLIVFASLLPSLRVDERAPRSRDRLPARPARDRNRRAGGEPHPRARRRPGHLAGRARLERPRYVMIARLAPAFQPSEPGAQLAWTVIGIGLYVATLYVVRQSRDLERYRFIMLFVALALLVSPLIPKFGENINGARLWVHFGLPNPIPADRDRQAPARLVLRQLLHRKARAVHDPTRRVGNHLLPDIRAFGPIAIAVVISLLGHPRRARHRIRGCWLFVVFLAMLWVNDGRWTHHAHRPLRLRCGDVSRESPARPGERQDRAMARSLKYLNDTAGYTRPAPVQGELAFGAAGCSGPASLLGLVGHRATARATSDFIFARVRRRARIFGTTAILAAFVLIIGAGLRAAMRARSSLPSSPPSG